MSRNTNLLCVGVACCFLVAGCGGGGGGSAAGGSMAVATADTDVVMHMDHEGLLQAPIIKNLMEKNKTDEVTMLASSPDAKAIVEGIQSKTGVHPLNDMKAMSIAMNLAGVDLQAMKGPGELPFVVGFDMTKEVSNDTVLAMGQVIAEKKGGSATMKNDLVFMQPDAAAGDEPDIWGAGTGTTALFGVSEELVKGAVDRAKAGEGSIPASLASVKSSLPSDAQVWAAAVIPDSVRQEIKKAGSGPQAGMVKPFEGIKSVAMSATAGTTLRINISADVGGDQQATQAAAMVNAMIPMAASMVPALMQKVQKGELQATSKGTMVSLSFELTEEELSQPTGAGMAPPPGR